MGEGSLAWASKSGRLQPLLSSAVALGIASDFGPVAYFPRPCTELLCVLFPSTTKEERIAAGSPRTLNKYKIATIIIMIITRSSF